MTEESKFVDPKVDERAAEDAVARSQNSTTDQDSAEEEINPADSKDPDSIAAGSVDKKKRSKRTKLKKAFGVGSKGDGDTEAASSESNPASKLTSGMVEQLLEMNPSLKSEVAGMDKDKATEKLKKLDVADLLTGMVCHS